MNQSEKRRKYGENYALWLRNYQRARSRVLTRLAQENPDRYKELMEEERARDEAEGKAWLDISGRTRRDSLANAAHSGGKDAKGLGNQVSPRNLGGEA